MVPLHLSLGLKGVQLLPRLFRLVTSTSRDAIMGDLLLIPLRLLPFVGSGLMSHSRKRLYTWMERPLTPFLFLFWLRSLHLHFFFSFLHCQVSFALLLHCYHTHAVCVFSGSCFLWLVHFLLSLVRSISKGSLQPKFKNKIGRNWWMG